MQSLFEQIFDNPLLVKNILLQTDYETTIAYCQTSQLTSEICRDRNMWEEKAFEKLGVSNELFRKTELGPSARYLQLLTYQGGLSQGSENYLYLDDLVIRAIDNNRDDLIQRVLAMGYNNEFKMLFRYAYNNNREKLALNGSDDKYISAALGALSGNHLDLFNSIVSSQKAKDQIFAKYGTIKRWESNLFSAAALSGNIELFNHIRKRFPQNEHNWNEIIIQAYQTKNYDMITFIKSLIPANYQLNYSKVQSTIFGNYTLAEIMELFGPIDISQIAVAAAAALRNGRLSSFEYLYNIDSSNSWDWNLLLSTSVSSNDKDLVENILNRVPEDYWIDYNRLLAQTIYKGGNIYLFNYIHAQTSDCEIIWSNLINNVLYTNNACLIERVVQLAISERMDNIYILKIAAIYCLNFNNLSLFDELIAYKPELIMLTAIDAIKDNNLAKFNLIYARTPTDYAWDSGILSTAGTPEVRMFMAKLFEIY